MKYHVQVKVGGDPWTGNAVDHDSLEIAEAAARDLFARWTIVQRWRVIDDDGKCVAVSQRL